MFSLRNIRTLARSAAPALLKNSSKAAQVNFTGYQTALSPLMKFQFSSDAQPEKVVRTLKSKEDFEKYVTESPVPVVLDFYADWCAPCRKLGPLIEDKYKKSNGDWSFAKVDVDQFGELASAFQVSSIPAVYMIHEGKVVDRFLGLVPDNVLDGFLQKAANLNKK